MKVTKRHHDGWTLGKDLLYTVRSVGLYIIVAVPSKGITLIWDKHTRLTVELQPHWRVSVAFITWQHCYSVAFKSLFISFAFIVFSNESPLIIHISFISQLLFKNQVCGLCGNFDASEMNDLQLSDSASKPLNCSTHINYFNENRNVDSYMITVVCSPMTFGNSWKATTPPCSDVTTEIFPCERNSYCSAWAQRRCMILKGDTFKQCHLLVCTLIQCTSLPSSIAFVTGLY